MIMAEAAAEVNTMTTDELFDVMIQGIDKSTETLIMAANAFGDAMWVFAYQQWHHFFYGNWPEPWRARRCAILRYLYPRKWQKFQCCKNKAQELGPSADASAIYAASIGKTATELMRDAP